MTSTKFPPCLAMSDGFVVTPSMIPQLWASLISSRLAVSMKIRMRGLASGKGPPSIAGNRGEQSEDGDRHETAADRGRALAQRPAADPPTRRDIGRRDQGERPLEEVRVGHPEIGTVDGFVGE